MNNAIAQWALQRRFDEIGVNFRNTWDLFLKIYTVILTANVVALAWFAANPQPAGPTWYLTVAFVVQDVLLAIQAVRMARYSGQARAEVRETAEALTALAKNEGEAIDPEKCFKTSLPVPQGVFGGWACCIGIGVVGLIWLLLVFRS
jgi:hypothetical protein